MTDREERQHVIEVLKQMRLDYEDFWEENDTEEIKAFNYAIASIETDLKYDLLYEETSGQADKNDLGVSSGLEKNSKKLENIATTKDYLGVDYLGVDAISRQAINGYIDYILSHGMGKRKSFEFIKKFVANLPPVTPQLSSGLDKNSKKLEKDFGESDCISRQATVKRLCNLAEFMNEHKEKSGAPYIMAALFIQDNKTEFPPITPQEPKSEWEHDHEILRAYADGANNVLDKLRAEIAEYGSIMVSYAITKDTKTDKGIEKLVSGVLKQAKEQVLEMIDKYKAESEE